MSLSGNTRGTYVDNTIYTLSNTALTSFDMASGNTLGTLKITQSVNDYYDYGYSLKQPVAAD